MLEDLHFTRQLGYQIERVLTDGAVMEFGGLMHEHWLRKRSRSEGMSNSRVDELYELARGAGGAKCKLTAAQLRELATLLDAGPAVYGSDEDQCWTLARITEVVRRQFGVDYTLAGMDLLLHRIGWSVQVPARRAAERDEARIAAWREERWPVVKDRGGPGRLDLFRRRIWPGLKAAEGPDLGPARHHPGGDGDRRQQQACLPRRADRRQAGLPARADLPRPPQPPAWQGPAQGVHQDGLRRSPGRRPPAAKQAHRARLGQPQLARQRRDDRTDRGPGLADRLPAAALRPRTQPRRAGLVPPETVPGQHG